MKIVFNFLLCFLVLGFALNAADKNKMLQDLDVIKNTYEVKYAPSEWKKTYLGWDLDNQINLTKSIIQTAGPLTVKDYQKILHSFFISMNDYHVHEMYFSTEFAVIQMEVRGVNGRYFISKISSQNFQKLTEMGLYRGAEIPQLGNEIVTFDGKPTHEAVDEIRVREIGSDDSKTSHTQAESFLFVRAGMMGHQVPQGTVTLQFLNNKKQLIDAEIDWIYNPEEVTNKSTASYHKPNASPIKSNRYAKQMINPSAQFLRQDLSKKIQKAFSTTLKKNNIEDTEPFYSEILDNSSLHLGKKIWKSNENSGFEAYIYLLPNSNKRIGYIRLDTFSPPGDIDDINEKAKKFGQLISLFQQKTDALVINQVDNPGGYVLYAYSLASMLSKYSLALPTHRFTITQEDVFVALDTIQDYEDDHKDPDFVEDEEIALGYPFDEEFYKSDYEFSKFIMSEWNAGKTFTSANYICGIEKIKPHPTTKYTKPIIVLVDNRDYSCADFFPAILQDNKRAVIFGEKTAGAGGIVSMHAHPNQFGIMGYSYTASFGERLDGTPLENLGVTPDIPYEVTVKDFHNGYKGYINAVNNAVNKFFMKKELKE